MILVSYMDGKILKHGFWHDKKVVLFDKDKTTVRKWEWVKIVGPFRAMRTFLGAIKIKISIEFNEK